MNEVSERDIALNSKHNRLGIVHGIAKRKLKKKATEIIKTIGEIMRLRESLWVVGKGKLMKIYERGMTAVVKK